MSAPLPCAPRPAPNPHKLRGVLLSIGIAASILIFYISMSNHTKKEIRYEITHRFPVEDPQFLRSMGELLGPAILPGNRVTSLQNGEQIFPAMLEAIRGAKESITFETYIYWSGEIGQKFSDALCERASAGVKIHVMLDWLGTKKIDAKYVAAMTAAGIEIERYNPLRWYNWSRMNNRTHRKLLVVDGRVGFTGGVGIADAWSGDASEKDHWRDSHYRIEGPAVAQMQAAFCDNWIKTKATVLFGSEYFPELSKTGISLAQIFKSSPDEGSESIRLMYLLSIASAKKSIRLQTAYFVPDDLSVESLVTARKRGAKIQIIVPGPQTDSEIAQGASRSRWPDLLDAGVLIYEYQPSLYHCKVLIVDDVWVSVGSTNFDNRSFRLNDEVNLNIYDAAFAAEQTAIFEVDKSVSRLMTRKDFKNRPLLRKMFDAVAGLFRHQL